MIFNKKLKEDLKIEELEIMDRIDYIFSMTSKFANGRKIVLYGHNERTRGIKRKLVEKGVNIEFLWIILFIRIKNQGFMTAKYYREDQMNFM